MDPSSQLLLPDHRLPVDNASHLQIRASAERRLRRLAERTSERIDKSCVAAWRTQLRSTRIRLDELDDLIDV